ncbi:MAG: hypothetical protein QG610_1997 [Euryarchaeota archaeon]|nr:hypothetical protein [Euryarchaeota archaeon]
MSKNTSLKLTFQLLSLLFCLVLIPVAFAQPAEPTETVAENARYERPAAPSLAADNGNYTVHSINPTYNYVCVMPGDSETFKVSFRNEGNETINVAPKVMDVPDSYYVLDKSWITISPASVKVEPGMEQDFKVEVNVPEDAESGEYQAQIVFTDDVYSYEYEDPEYIQDTEPQYVNVMYLGISVPVRPKLELQTSYISDTIKPGVEYVYEIKIKNVAGKDVTIDPEVTDYDCCGYPCSESAFSDDIIEISVPSVIKAGEIAKMTVRIPVPENASGYYSGLIEMNADGNENDGSVPQIGLDFNVIKQPSGPYVKTFTTTTTDPIKITVSTDTYIGSSVRISPKKEEPSLDVSLKCNSNPAGMTLVETTESSYIYSQWYGFPAWSIEEGDSNYESSNGHVETYKISGAVGTWELTILPKNAESFSCSVTVGDSEKKVK